MEYYYSANTEAALFMWVCHGSHPCQSCADLNGQVRPAGAWSNVHFHKHCHCSLVLVGYERCIFFRDVVYFTFKDYFITLYMQQFLIEVPGMPGTPVQFPGCPFRPDFSFIAANPVDYRPEITTLMPDILAPLLAPPSPAGINKIHKLVPTNNPDTNDSPSRPINDPNRRKSDRIKPVYLV